MIFYLCPDHAEPSWGVGLLYWHVKLLNAAGFAACVLHEKRPFRIAWCEAEVPIRYLEASGCTLVREDVLVVPEVLAAHPFALATAARRVVFVQGAFLVERGLGGASGYPELGYQAALGVLPCVVEVVTRFYGLPAVLMPPFVMPYFFTQLEVERERRILVVSKAGYRAAGFPDEEILWALLGREISRCPGWAVERLQGLDHRGVAELFSRSMFLVNVNSMEAFNTSVPEAMAAGCVPFCYQAFGGRDFLVDGVNARVFANHDVFGLVTSLRDWIDDWLARQADVARLRAGGRATAASFSSAATSRALARFFAGFGASP